MGKLGIHHRGIPTVLFLDHDLAGLPRGCGRLKKLFPLAGHKWLQEFQMLNARVQALLELTQEQVGWVS